MYTADNMCKMIELLIDNIFMWFGGRIFRQVIVGMNCAPLLTISFTHMRTNFWTISSEVPTGDLPGYIIYAIDTLMN